MIRNANARKGFTLIELLVVVLILGILVAVALPSYLSSVNQSRLNTTNANAKTLATAIQAAGVSEGTYPSTWSTDTNVLSNLGQIIPADPCNGDTVGGTAGNWTVTVTGGNNATVVAKNAAAGANPCTTTPTTYTINL